MIGFLFGKVMWVGRAATFCVGLAVVLAVVLGVGTTALAAVPGDPFKLGRLNTVDRVTSLVGGVTGPLLRVDNNGGGPALALESNPGRPPLAVNAGSGKVANLDADRLDGKDASSFLAAEGKAQAAARADTAGDAGTLDGKDSTGFLAANGKARDAETVDGRDSSEFMGYFGRGADAGSASDSSSSKTVYASCPAGEIALGGGASIERPVFGVPDQPAEFPVALQSVRDFGYSGWMATATEMAPYDGAWRLLVNVTCVPAQDGVAYAD